MVEFQKSFDTKVEPISWENPHFNFCVGVWVGIQMYQKMRKQITHLLISISYMVLDANRPKIENLGQNSVGLKLPGI